VSETSPPSPLSEGEGDTTPLPFGEGPGVGFAGEGAGGFAGEGFLQQRKNSCPFVAKKLTPDKEIL